MRTHAAGKICVLALVGVVLAAALPTSALAQPVVKTVPWVATNPLIPHDTWSGKSIRLKGTSDVQGAGVTFVWDFGDGSAATTPATVANGYAIEAAHVYTGVAGQVFTATLTVTNANIPVPNATAKHYFVVIRDRTLDVEVNVAIDEGLWYLHKTMTRSTCGALPCGYWNSGSAGSGYHSNDAVNVNAFLVNGHKEGGDAGNPYVETVERAVRCLFTRLASTTTISNQTNPLGTFNPDHNGNGIALYMTQGQEFYQTGPVISAIVATGTPAKLTDVGAASVIGRKYADIVQDLVDRMAYCQYDSGTAAGGWRYSCQEAPDNSAAQWAAIGLLAARGWGTGVAGVTPVWFDDLVTRVNYERWLTYSQNADGRFGYTSPTYWAWGWYATTPSGMVQCALDGYGRGSLLWDRAEAFMRTNFCNTGNYSTSVRDYYYGLFALVKAMLVHDSNGDGVPEPLELLGATGAIDWYRAQVSSGDPCDGVARTLVGDQNAAGYWWGHGYTDGRQYPFETAWAILMLSRTLFEAGSPVAVATVTPNPAVLGQTVTFSGSASFHQDASKAIDSWAWEICKTAGAPITSCPALENKSGVVVTSSFGALGLYQARLTVNDNGVPERSASSVVTVNVAIPPLAPTANAGGPYSFCSGTTPWYLDGTGSVNPDDGVSEPGSPPDFIREYAWDLDGDGEFDDALGAQPGVTTFFTAKGVGSYLVQLRVSDNTKLSFPSIGHDLTDTDTAQVIVRAADDPLCSCNTLTARAKPTKADLVWTLFPGAASYHVYRGTITGGPYLYIANATGTVYADFGLTNGVTYHWVVRPAALNGNELCQSNQASATPTARAR